MDKKLTPQASFPCSPPAQIFVSRTMPPYLSTHVACDTMGTWTSCKFVFAAEAKSKRIIVIFFDTLKCYNVRNCRNVYNRKT